LSKVRRLMRGDGVESGMQWNRNGGQQRNLAAESRHDNLISLRQVRGARRGSFVATFGVVPPRPST